MSAKPYYVVTVEFGIGMYKGDWDGKEPRMREQYTFLCISESKKFARAFYKRIAKEKLKGTKLP